MSHLAASDGQSLASECSSFGHEDTEFPLTLPRGWTLFVTYLVNLHCVHGRAYQGITNSERELKKGSPVAPSPHLSFIIF